MDLDTLLSKFGAFEDRPTTYLHIKTSAFHIMLKTFLEAKIFL